MKCFLKKIGMQKITVIWVNESTFCVTALVCFWYYYQEVLFEILNLQKEKI